MGNFVIKPVVQIAAWLITAVLVYLNLSMVIGQAADYFASSDNLFWKIVICLSGIAFITLLIITIVYPLLKKRRTAQTAPMHGPINPLHNLEIPRYTAIAVALDFSDNDSKLLAHALGQGHAGTSYLLLHVVESVPARIYAHDSDDIETQKDKERLLYYARELKEKGFNAEARIGFGNRSKEIVRLVLESRCDMLVIGAHGHTGLKDLFYGETVNTVRHELKIPVLVVHV